MERRKEGGWDGTLLSSKIKVTTLDIILNVKKNQQRKWAAINFQFLTFPALQREVE